MKVGIALSFLEFRNDIRRVIVEILREHEVVLFLPRDQVGAMRSLVPDGAEVRLIDEQTSSLRLRLWKRLFHFFGHIPRSVGNYYLMERFLILLGAVGFRRRLSLLSFDLAMHFPKWLSYDKYINGLSYKATTPIDDIDRFVLLTRIVDDAFLSRLLREGRDVRVYVYSWDHPCKHRQFSRRVDYLVWSQGIRDDLVELQNIPREKIRSIGASQLGYLHEFLEQDGSPEPYDFPYIYLGCFAGIREMVLQEVEIILRISKVISSSRPDMRLVVRPYPMVRENTIYGPLREAANIVMDDDYLRQDLSTAEDKIQDKLSKIYHAQAFLHLGTTMGLEACFTDTPSFIIDFGYHAGAGRLSIEHGIRQYQNKKYLIDSTPTNVLRREEDVRQMLGSLKDPAYLSVNNHIRRTFPLTSFDDFARELVD